MESLLNVKQLARTLNISRPYVYKLVDEKKIPHIAWQSITDTGKPKRVIRFEPAEIERWVASNRVK